ncbi:MAG: methyl-accepting chemotaxis protein, partial [Lachnospiraceae bacterium]|nr:methyl-accepting chemotaxis protein [Lachnospiraceae bacterium]
MKKKSTSLRTKLIGIIVPIVILIIVSFFILARNMVLQISKDELLAQSQVSAEKITAWTQQIFGELKIYKDTIETGGFESDAEILAYMEGSVEKSEAYPVGLYMGDDNGVYLDGSGWVPGDDWILVERDWYVDGKDNEEFAFGDPYYDSMTGDTCVSASVRVDYPSAVRVLATDVYLDFVVGLITEIASREDVGAFLVTKGTNTIIAHPDTEMLAQTLDTEGYDSLYANVGEAINEGKDGVISIKGDASKYYVALNQIENTDWYLVTYITERDMLSDLHWMEMYMVLIALAATIILVFGILRITNQVVRPVQKVTGVIGQIAEGDFTQDLEVSGSDEIAVMSNNMQMFISNMRNTITEINHTAQWLNKQSLANEQVSNSLIDASKNQEGSMSLMGKLAEILSGQAAEVSNRMDYLAELVKKTHEDGNLAKSLMGESVGMSQSGKKDMEHINEGMISINQSISTLSAQIEKVGQAMAQIDDMVSMIMDIAEETNLLSLNASIEAARAGESGRGFAVVAEQIGKLAANSSTAADDIAKLTEEINHTVSAAVEDMEASVVEVEKNVSIVSEAKTTFVNLYGKVEETSRRVEQMIDSIGKVNEVANQLDAIMEKQNIVASQISDSAKEMSETTESMTTSSSIVAESAEELKKESVELMEKMNQFRV